MIYGDFKAKVAAFVNRVDIDDMIPLFVKMAVSNLEKYCLWFQAATTTITTEAGKWDYQYPSDCLLIRPNAVFASSGGSGEVSYTLVKKRFDNLVAMKQLSPANDLPRYYAASNAIYLYPVPDAVYTVTIYYFKTIGVPANDTVANDWTAKAWDLTFWATVEAVWQYIGDPAEEAKAAANKYRLLSQYLALTGRMTGTGHIEYKDI